MTDSAPGSDSAPDAAPAIVPGTKKRFLRQVLRLAGPYWNCERRAKVRGATLLVLLLTMGQVGLTVWSNYWHGALFDALEQRSVHAVLLQVAIFALIFVLSIAVTATHLIVKRWLMIDWRAWLTEQLVGSWMEDGRHYRLLFSAGDHDNPDQRIAEDIRIATESAITLAHSLIYSLMILCLFIDILWSVSGTIVVPGTGGLQMKGYMVPLAFVYAALGSVFGWMIGHPLVRATNALQTAEATFRFGLSRARENTEAIALMRGEPLERAGSSMRFGQIVREWDRQSLAYMGLVAFGAGYGALLPVFPILVAAPQYIQGAMSLGVLMQAAQAFQQLTSALSWPVDNIGEIARCRASGDRVLSLYEDIRQLDNATAPGGSCIVLDRSERAHLVIEDLCIAEPSGRILLEHFSADIRRGERVLISGDSAVTGCLFKVIGGLWPWGSGRVRLPADGGMLFIAQRPFLPEGTLRETLCYPHPPDTFPDSAIRHALECAGLTWIATRMDERDNWEQVLPQRAQQRLSFARVLLQRPAWIFMEEATDAFDPKGERLILEMLQRELPNTTLLNISFHPGLRNLHHRELVLSLLQEEKFLPDGRSGNGGGAH